MELKNIEKEVTYRITDKEGTEHCYTIASSIGQNNDHPVTYICGSHPHEEIEIPNFELPFFAKAVNLFLEEHSNQ